MSDLSPDRLAAARRLGANVAGEALSGEYDVVFDAVGSAATRAGSVAHQRPGGVAVWLGLADEEAGFDANALVRSEKRVLGSFAYDDGEFAQAMAQTLRRNHCQRLLQSKRRDDRLRHRSGRELRRWTGDRGSG